MSEHHPLQSAEDLQGACEEFLQTGDSDVLLVAVSEQVGNGSAQEAAATLLREEYQPIVVAVGWDLLILLAPHLHSRSTHCWNLLQHITKLCPPKEMSLALLEQMELTADSTALFLMLELLQKVILELQREATVVSCLRSACWLLQCSYRQLEDSCEWFCDGMRQESDSETTEENNSMESEYPHSMSDACGGGQHSMSDACGGGGQHSMSDACGGGGQHSMSDACGGDGQHSMSDACGGGGQHSMSDACGGDGQHSMSDACGGGGQHSMSDACGGDGQHSMSDEYGGDGQHSMSASPALGEDEVIKTACGESVMKEKASLQLAPVTADSRKKVQSDREGLNVTWLASQAVQFIGPFVEEIHQLYRSPTPQIRTCWSPRQRECITLLLSLLDYPLVRCDLTSSGQGSQESCTAEAVMEIIVKCHCGCVELLGWKGGGIGRLGGEQEATEDDEVALSPVGLACFAYLLLCEDLCASYLPTVVSSNHLLHIGVNHTVTLLQRPERLVILKGLLLLQTLIGRVHPLSLPSHLLDDKRYLRQAELLTDLMVTCPHKSVRVEKILGKTPFMTMLATEGLERRQSVPLLLDLVKCFSDTGRYRLYQSLLHSTRHPGVQELLIHSIKNEIDQSLKVGRDSLFIGPNLVPFLDQVMNISSDMDLLKESSRVMAVLNFLRYLLIRDKLSDNQTGIWTTVGVVREKFTTPLRQLLMATKAHCRYELKVKQDEHGTGAGVRSEGGTEVTVEVMGERLPNMKPEDEIQALQVAEQHLAMMGSVVVRVEELMEGN